MQTTAWWWRSKPGVLERRVGRREGAQGSNLTAFHVRLCETRALEFAKPFYPSRWDSSTSCVCLRSGWLRPLCSRAVDPPPASKQTLPWRRDEAAQLRTCRPPKDKKNRQTLCNTFIQKILCHIFISSGLPQTIKLNMELKENKLTRHNAHEHMPLPCCEWQSRCTAEPPGHRWGRWRGSCGSKSGQISGCYGKIKQGVWIAARQFRLWSRTRPCLYFLFAAHLHVRIHVCARACVCVHL